MKKIKERKKNIDCKQHGLIKFPLRNEQWQILHFDSLLCQFLDTKDFFYFCSVMERLYRKVD